MKLKKMIKVAALAVSTLLGVTASAAEWTYNNQKVSYTGTAEKITIADSSDLVLKFTSSGTLTLPGATTANILVVGGGGNGGAGSNAGKNGTPGNGGAGGAVTEALAFEMSSGSYTVTVGAANAKSSIEGTNLEAIGGSNAGEASADSGVNGKDAGVYDWTGTSVYYGKGGVAGNPEAGAPNSGNGGGGGYAGKKNNAGASGGSGVVIVRITSMKNEVSVQKTIFVGEDFTLPEEGQQWGTGWTVSSEGSAVKVVTTETGLKVTGEEKGTATVKVEDASTIYKYTINVQKYAYTNSVSVPLDGYLPLEQEFSDFESVVMDDAAKAKVGYQQAGKKVTLTGLELTGDDPVTVVVETKAATYTYTVSVVDKIVSRGIQLATGAEGTSTTHEESFEVMEGKTLSVSVSDTSVVTVTTDGNKITFTPARGTSAGGEPREATVTVENVTINGVEKIVKYTVKVTDYDSGLTQFDNGFVAYTGVTPQVVEEGGDLLLVFNQSGTFTIPSLHEATMTVLAVGGGGAGGSQPDVKGNGAAGGGAGGFVLKENLKLVGATYTVTVGQGGAARDVGEWPVSGLSGGNSTLSVGEFAYVSAIGGGGGAAPATDENNGFPGGSSGGAAWFGMKSCGKAGEPVDGQGWSGAVPQFLGNGGGGGGAGGVASEFTGGVGKANSLGGSEVTYAKGGNGWDYMNKTTATDAGEAGVNPGDGGNAGMGTTAGGAGANGVVIVRISKLAPVVQVPVPTERDILDLRHQWADDATYSGLKEKWGESKFISPSDGNEHTWSEAVERVYFAGNNETVTCSAGTDGAKVGIGYYNFTFYLKDGYAWADGSLTEEKSFRWSIVENLDNPDANIGIDKSVSPIDKDSKATVTIDTFSSPEMTGKSELNVLFIGTACPNHGLKASTISASLNAILEKANVNYFLYASSTLKTSGSQKMGYTFSETAFDTAMGSGGDHKALSAFYARLNDELLVQKNEYDYIVFEIDGSRLAAGYTSQSQYEAAVSAALKPYYESKKVIWIVDDPDAQNASETRYPAEIGRNSADGRIVAANENGWSDSKNDYWRPNTYFFNTSQNDNNLAYDGEDSSDGGLTAYRGLVGMFDPAHYSSTADTFAALSSATAADVTRYNDGRTEDFTSTYYAADGIENQAYYTKPDEVTMMLSSSIRPKAYNFRFEDAIAAGLSVETVTVKVCTVGANGIASTDPNNWHEVMVWDATNGVTTYDEELEAAGIPEADMTVDATTRAVNAVYWNIDFPLWTKVDIEVSDADGTFRKTVQESDFNAVTGLYEKNPNDGRAHAWLTAGTGDAEEELNVEGYADTLLPWSFDLYKVTGEAVNGSIFVGNTEAQEVTAVPGDTVVVTFRPDTGYVLESVEIDGVLQDVDFTTKSVTIEDIQKDHHVKVVYVKYEAPASLVSLWISDHADAGSKFVHLAFMPTLKIGEGDAKNVTAMNDDEKKKAWTFFSDVGTAGGISVIIAKTQADLDSGNFVSSKVNLRQNWDRDFTTKGWVWVTVPSTAKDITAEGMCWKIVVQQPGGEETVSE